MYFMYKQDMHYDAILCKWYTIPLSCDSSDETVLVVQIKMRFIGSPDAYSGMNMDFHNTCESLINESLRILF